MELQRLRDIFIEPRRPRPDLLPPASGIPHLPRHDPASRIDWDSIADRAPWRGCRPRHRARISRFAHVELIHACERSRVLLLEEVPFVEVRHGILAGET